MDAAGGGVRVLLAPTNLSLKPISKQPIVYDSYGIPLGITTGTFQLVPTWQTFNLRLQTKVLTAYSTLITFPTHHFYNLTQPLENTTHIADQWPNAKQCVFLFILSYRCACRQPIQYREMIIMANRKKSSSSNRISRC